VITKFVDRLKNKQPPVIFGDGTQVRDFIYVKDVVQANLLAMTSKVDSGFFNIGTGVATSIEDLAHILIDLFGARLEPVHEKPLKGDIKISQADISLAKNLLGWQPKTDLRDGLRVFLEN
jgi:UDP-glucose 4-epimerase